MTTLCFFIRDSPAMLWCPLASANILELSRFRQLFHFCTQLPRLFPLPPTASLPRSSPPPRNFCPPLLRSGGGGGGGVCTWKYTWLAARYFCPRHVQESSINFVHVKRTFSLHLRATSIILRSCVSCHSARGGHWKYKNNVELFCCVLHTIIKLLQFRQHSFRQSHLSPVPRKFLPLDFCNAHTSN